MRTTPIACHSVSKVYPGVLACRHVSVEFRAREIHALLGENGAGKSTLVKILAGVFRPDEGTLLLDGRPVQFSAPAQARRTGISVLHQVGSLISTLTVAENLQLAGVLHPALARVGNSTSAIVSSQFFEACACIAPNRLAGQLSPSERKVVEVYRALTTGTRVLVLDEPTATLAPQESEWLFQHLRELASHGFAVVVVSHKLPEVVNHSDRFTLLRHGQVVARLHRKDGVTVKTLAQLMFADARGVRSEPTLAGDKQGKVYPSKDGSGVAVDHSATDEATDSSSAGRPDAKVLDYLLELQRTGAAQPDSKGKERVKKTHSGKSFALSPLVRLSNVSTEAKSPYESSLQNLSLAFLPGRVVGIAGRPGCGVVTMFDLLSGRKVRLTGGEFAWDKSALHSVGVVSANARIEGSIDELTVSQNLALRQRDRLGLRGWLRGNLRTFAMNLMERFDVQPRSHDMLAGQLSGGNRQKMILARELTHAKDLLLAMNPTAGLDLSATQFVQQALKDKAQDGCCVVVYSEDLDELVALADLVHVLSRGRLVASLANSEISPERIGRALTELDDNGADCPSIRTETIKRR